MHIPKCGGTTLQAVFDRMYTQEECLGLNDFTIHYFTDLSTEQQEKINVLMGHLHFGQHIHFNTKDFKYLTMLRKPVDMIISNYYYVQRTSTHPAHEAVIKQ